MGAWSTSLYGNDDSADLRDRLRTLMRLPGDGDALFARLQDEFAGLKDPEDEGFPDLVLAAADQFHLHDIPCAALFAAAKSLIASGRDLAVKRELEMSEPDLRKRAVMLKDFAERLSKPHPKLRPRRALKQPEPMFAEPGACFRYPIDRRGECINPYLTAKIIAEEFKPHAWGAIAVLWSGHIEGYFAASLVARLKLNHKPKPDLAAARTAHLDWSKIRGSRTHGLRAIAMGTFNRAHLKKMRMEPMGVLPIDPAKVAAFYPAVKTPPQNLGSSLSNVADYSPVYAVGGLPIAGFLA